MTPHAIISSLLTNCPSKAWYIAGGSVASPNNYRDIDIFVPTEADFDQVNESLLSASCILRSSSKFAVTYIKYVNKNNLFGTFTKPYLIQLIKKFYPVEEQLAHFDINVCRRAILADGTSYNHPTAHTPIYVDTASTQTCARILKYANRGFAVNYERLTSFLEQFANKELEGFNFYTNESSILTYEHTLALICSGNLQLSQIWVDVFLQLPQSERTALTVDRLTNIHIAHINNFQHIPEFALIAYLQTGRCSPLVQQHYPEYLV